MPLRKFGLQTSIVVSSPLGAVQSYQTVARLVNPGAGSGSPGSAVAPRSSPDAVAWAPLPRSCASAKSSLAGGVVWVKIAVTERAWFMVIWHVAVSDEQPPAQPVKVEPDAAVAIRVTSELATKECWQLLPQSTPSGLERTEPKPLPVLPTLRV